MARALVADIVRHGAEILVVAGDVSAAALPTELAESRALLDEFGSLGGSLPGQGGPSRRSVGFGGGRQPSAGDRMLLVARGNHDQPHRGPAYAQGASVPGHPDRYDTVPGAYPLDRCQLRVAEVGGLRLVGLDTTTVDTAGGAIAAAQFSELEAVLRQSPAQPTVVFGHHPVTDESARTAIAGPSFVLDRGDAARLQELYASTPGVFFHHAGHTHRNLRTRSSIATGVEFLEVAAVKEYPGGYSLLRIYEGGYTVNFHKSSSPDALRWSQLTSGQYLGLYPAYTLGSLEDRNHVVLHDFSKL
jgi:3',5'-cyclic AMP phosphodiesterase CpdA